MTHEDLARALRRLVYTDKLLTLEEAHRYCDLTGIPRGMLDDSRRERGLTPR